MDKLNIYLLINSTEYTDVCTTEKPDFLKSPVFIYLESSTFKIRFTFLLSISFIFALSSS